MKTISIGTQSSAAELVTAFANALAAEIGWTAEKDADGNLTGNVKKSGIDVFFRFFVYGSYVRLTVSNGYLVADTYASKNFSASSTYHLWVLESANGSVAVGFEAPSYTPYLSVLIARNSAGVYVGMSCSSSTIHTVRGVDTESRKISLSANYTAGVSTSIVKMPDIWGDAMFVDLYYVVSCPFQSTDRVFYIGGKNYRSIGTNSSYMYFALPEE